MANKLNIRRGEQARYIKTHCNWAGNPISTTKAVVTILGSPRNRLGRFCPAEEYDATVKVRYKNGNIDEVDCDDLSVYNTIWDLTHDELKDLRSQVVMGSCYLGDYENNYGIDTKQVADFCEGFGESIGWNEDMDTPDNFADYCEGVERYDKAV